MAWKSITLLLCLSSFAVSDLALADEQSSPDQLVPFTAQTNYMSLKGYRRWKDFLATGVWQKPKRFLVYGLNGNNVYLDQITTFSGSTVIIRLGDLPADLMDLITDQALQLAYEAYPSCSTFTLKWETYLFNQHDILQQTYQRPKAKVIKE